MFNRFLHIALAFNLMVATIGVTIDKHFCGELLQKVSLLGKTGTCCDMEAEMPEDCCHNETEALQLDDDFQKPHFAFSFQSIAIHPIVFIPKPSFNFFQTILLEKDHFLIYKPPLLFRNIPVLIQSFLL
ncbi:MAG: hypothetical protein AAGI07_06230 [Bacteroidota bacterium]